MTYIAKQAAIIGVVLAIVVVGVCMSFYGLIRGE
jgi:hypothetical protein